MSETYTKVIEDEKGISFYKGKYLVKFFDKKYDETFHYDRQGRLHREYGPAREGKNRRGDYYIHGIFFDENKVQSRLEQLVKIRETKREAVKVYYFCVFCLVVGIIVGATNILAIILPVIVLAVSFVTAFQLDKDYEVDLFRSTNGER